MFRVPLVLAALFVWGFTAIVSNNAPLASSMMLALIFVELVQINEYTRRSALGDSE